MAIATPAFLAAWLPSGRDAVTLVKVELTDPSALTLYLATREVSTPEATPLFWQGALSDVGTVIEPGNLGAFDPGLATFDFTLSGRPLAGQGVDDSALELLASYYWYGATVTAWYWETSLTSGIENGDALQIFKGVVIDQETDGNQARLYCQQRNDWIVRVPLAEVTRATYPRAPEKSVGRAVPICYGDLRPPPARSPASEYGTFQHGINSTVGIRRAGVRGVVASLGKGGGDAGKVIFAGHACKLFNSDTDGSTPAIEIGGLLAEVDPLGGMDFNAADGTGFDFDDITGGGNQPFDCFFPVLLLDHKQAASNPGENGRAATDGFNDTSYAILDYDAGQRMLEFPLPSVPAQGTAYVVKYVVGYLTSAGATALRIDINDGAVTSGTSTIPASTTRTAVGGALVGTAGTPLGATVGYGWDIGALGWKLRVYFTGTATGQTARIFYTGVVLQFRPNWPMVTPAYKIQIPGVRDYRMVQTIGGSRRHNFSHQPRDVWIPQEEQVDATFYATLQGYADDGGGTYTGSAAALIQRPPDILRHFLATYCGETLFETASSNPGDLEDLRDSLKTWRASDMVAAFAVEEFKMSSDVVRDLARSTACWFFISCFDDKWCGIPWRAARTVDFPRRFTRYDLLEESGPSIILRRDEVLNDLRVSYGMDAWSRRTVHETRLGPNHSTSGHKYRQLRDERITVVASESDRLDFTDSGGAHTASLTPGDYSGIDFAQHLQTQIRAVSSDTIGVAYGYEIVAGFNNKLDFNDGANKTATLTAGVYTAETLATHIAAQMNAVSTLWSCAYSRTTRIFTISRSAGTAQVLFGSGANLLTSVATTIGFIMIDQTGFAAYASGIESEEERFIITSDGNNVTLDFESGANGIDAATPRACGMLLGFDMARDTDSAGGVLAHSPKSTREHDCATSVTRFGARPETSIELDAVNDTDTAREVRNRILDLWGQPPVEIQFSTERAPDLQKGMVFDFDASLDEVKPYAVPGSDGSWAGKKFVAVQVERRTFSQFVVAFEVPAA